MATSNRSRCPALAGLALAFLLLASSWDAGALTLLSDGRYFTSTQRTEGEPPVTTTETPDTPFGPFQNSEINLVKNPGSGDLLSGNASGEAIGILLSSDSFSSVSVFSIQFRVDAPSAAVDLSGLLEGAVPTFVELSSGPTILYSEYAFFDGIFPVPTPFSFSTLIGPGDYQLRAVSQGIAGIPGSRVSGTYSLDFSISENVPEPGTALLLALGLSGLHGTRRHVRSRAA